MLSSFWFSSSFSHPDMVCFSQTIIRCRIRITQQTWYFQMGPNFLHPNEKILINKYDWSIQFPAIYCCLSSIRGITLSFHWFFSLIKLILTRFHNRYSLSRPKWNKPWVSSEMKYLNIFHCIFWNTKWKQHAFNVQGKN